MISSALEHWLINQVASGACVLFVGAGLSRGCMDPTGRHGPSGDELAKEIAEHLLGQHKGWPLAATASFAIATASRREVDAFVAERLAGLNPAPYLDVVPRLPWRSIY